MRNRETKPARTQRILHFFARHKAGTISIAVLAFIGIILVVALWPRPQELSRNPAVAEYQRQLPSLKKAAEQNPNDTDAQKNYAIALYAAGDTKAAKLQYEKVIEQSPKDPIAYNNLANIQRDMGDIQDAIQSYRQSLTLDPKQSNVYANLANVQMYLLNKPDDAIETYKKGLEELPANAELELLLGMAYERTDDQTAAKQTYLHILSYEANNQLAKSALQRLGN